MFCCTFGGRGLEHFSKPWRALWLLQRTNGRVLHAYRSCRIQASLSDSRTFRYAPSETAFFFNKSRVPPHACPAHSPDIVCAKIKDEGLPWYTLFSLFVVAAGCGACSLIGIAYQHIGGEDKENEEEKKKKTKDEETRMAMMEIRSLLDLEFGKISKALQSNPRPDAAGSAEPQVVESSRSTGTGVSTPRTNSSAPEAPAMPNRFQGSS